MEKNNETQTHIGVSKRLSTLPPDDEWKPNISKGLAQLHERQVRALEKRRLVLALVASAVACLGLLALPATLVTTRHIWKSRFGHSNIPQPGIAAKKSGSGIAT